MSDKTIVRKSIIYRAGDFIIKRLKKLVDSRFSGTIVITFFFKDGGLSRTVTRIEEEAVNGIPKD